MDLAVSKLNIKTASSSHLSDGIRIFLIDSDKWAPKTPSLQLSERIKIFRIGADNCKKACISLESKSSALFSITVYFPQKNVNLLQLFLFKIISAAMTPGTQPQSVSRNTMSIEPQPWSITASGGKIMARMTWRQDIYILYFVCFYKKVFGNMGLLFFYNSNKALDITDFSSIFFWIRINYAVWDN